MVARAKVSPKDWDTRRNTDGPGGYRTGGSEEVLAEFDREGCGPALALANYAGLPSDQRFEYVGERSSLREAWTPPSGETTPRWWRTR